MKTYALVKYPAVSAETFDEMIEFGITQWQQDVAQNNPDAGYFWYPALDPVGDTPTEGITTFRMRLRDVVNGPKPRLILWTDGSAPKNEKNVRLEELNPVNAYGERTEIELIIDDSNAIYVESVEK